MIRGPVTVSSPSTLRADLSSFEEATRRAKRQAEIKEGKRPLVAIIPKSGATQVSNTISDSNIRILNRAVIRSEAYLEANKIWEEGKILGLVSNGKEEEVIQKLAQMEERDRSQWIVAKKKTELQKGLR